MRALSWLHFYLESSRARRTLRDCDRLEYVAAIVDGRVIACMQWRSPRCW